MCNCNCNFCCGNYAENGYWKDKQMKECQDKIRELEAELAKSRTSAMMWRERALYQAPVFKPYEPTKPTEPKTSFPDILFILLTFVLPWVMVVGSFLFGWNGILR